MGNRAVITFDERLAADSIGIYVHWNGGPESIYTFVNAARELGIRAPKADPSYCVARFAQMIGNFFGGTTSVGIGPLRSLDINNGDNGVFLVTDFGLSSESAVIHQYAGSEASLKRKGKKLSWATVRRHPYCNPNDSEHYMLPHVLAANKMFRE